jgi:hypothetical protein
MTWRGAGERGEGFALTASRAHVSALNASRAHVAPPQANSGSSGTRQNM